MNRDMRSSISENNGLAAIAEQDQKIYSVGISTGGAAEMRMALASSTRHITATTIDREGANFAKKQIKEAGLLSQIDVKVEDVASPLSYVSEYFDFVYARLVLHYLPKNSLMQALDELYRVLKKGGKMFVVVRSVDCIEAQNKCSLYDPQTRLTTYTSGGLSYSRYFHSEESIRDSLVSSGFYIKHVKNYSEQLCVDFQRMQASQQIDPLIEVLATK